MSDPGSDAFAATQVDDTAVSGTPARSDVRAPARDTRIGRFVVLDQLGTGGMGVVIAAYDPQLDRKVAIKMLHDAISESHAARLEREAKAMAQLSHPNVVTVHETGTFEGRLYIAMEYVDGQTLREWLRAAPRAHDQILDVLVQAGQGLAAAHAVGLVHRDFKPDNVLVGKDGRVRVSDFGLAQIGATSEERLPEAAKPTKLDSLTVTGAVLGTPLYMAPEQHGGRTADAKADQFAFCVTLWQALCEDLPYGADTYDDLVENVTGGKLRPMPKGVRVSPKLRAILVRGLAAAPAERWPSMQDLLAAIARTRRRVRWPLIAAGGVALAGAGVASTLLLRGGAGDPCPPALDRIAAVWSSPRVQTIEAAFVATTAPNAHAVWTGIRDHVDRYTATWLDRRRAVCRATRVSGEQSEDLLDARVHCLDVHLGELDALLGELAHVSRDGLYKALDATVALPAFGDCDDVSRLRDATPLPTDPTVRAKIADLEGRYAELVALDRVGRYPRVRELVGPLVADAEQLAYAPLLAKILLLRAGSEFRAGDLDAAEASYRATAAAAARARDDARIAQSWIDLMQALAARGRIADALALLDIARTATERVSDQVRLGARFHNVVAGIDLAQRKYPEAKAEYETALELVRRDAPDSDLLGPALLNLGTVLWYTGDLDGAAAKMEAARARFVATLGPHHPSLGYVHRNLGDLWLAKQDVEGALAHYTEAATIFEDANGPDHIDNAIALEPLAYVYAKKGDLERARAIGERALALRENKLGKDHPSLASLLENLSDIALRQGRAAEARDYLARSVRIKAAMTAAAGH